LMTKAVAFYKADPTRAVNLPRDNQTMKAQPVKNTLYRRHMGVFTFGTYESHSWVY
jgi:hypothetical protein